ncbi:sugar transferase [Modestobacter excelsi]|uniref:sugar transferase n=1 Tax=Modestobacter excelsi TaxID=2213161 RepID=UPI002482F60D|nr:sugar transferase [Modestobacter excelsi]
MSLTIRHDLDPHGPLPPAKAVLDRLVAAVVLLLAAPWMTLLTVLLWSHGDGPVLQRERRLGQWGRPFDLLRFRTVDPAGPGTDRVGALLRRICLDELPQLINVLRGEMSLVGPRATSPADGRRATMTVTRLALKPGLIGLDELGEGRAGEDAPAVVDRYLREWSLRLDVVILWHAVRRAARGPAV